jgi:hypothetical protein
MKGRGGTSDTNLGIHESYASDGWSDTMRDFYNNKKGIQIGKQVENIIGPDRMMRIRGEGNNNVLFEINTADAWKMAWDAIQDLVVKNAKGNGLAVLPVRTYQNIPNYNPTPYMNSVLPDAQRFWRSPVFYNPNPADKKPSIYPK